MYKYVKFLKYETKYIFLNGPIYVFIVLIETVLFYFLVSIF